MNELTNSLEERELTVSLDELRCFKSFPSILCGSSRIACASELGSFTNPFLILNFLTDTHVVICFR